MSQGVSSFGMNFQIGESDGSYVDLGCVISAELPGSVQQFVEDKCLGQDTRGIRSIATYQDLGEATFMTKYSGSGFDANLEHCKIEPPKRLYAKITFPKEVISGVAQTTAAVLKFRCYLKQSPVTFPEDGGRLTMSIAVKCDGWDETEDWNFTAGS